MAQTNSQKKVKFIKTNKGTIDTFAKFHTEAEEELTEVIGVNTSNNMTIMGGTTIIPANPLFVDTKYDIKVTESQTDTELVILSFNGTTYNGAGPV